MPIISTMKRAPARGLIKGTCPNQPCGKDVYESLVMLDDAYNVWVGKCPHCDARAFLSMTHGLRGYGAGGMHLVLPTDEERDSNTLPKDCPTRGSKGPADWHGTVAGELQHRIRTGKPL